MPTFHLFCFPSLNDSWEAVTASSSDGSSCLRTKWNCRSIPIRLFWIWEKQGPASVWSPWDVHYLGAKWYILKQSAKVRVPLVNMGRCYTRHCSSQGDWAEAINEWNKGWACQLWPVSGIHIGISGLGSIQIKCTRPYISEYMML